MNKVILLGVAGSVSPVSLSTKYSSLSDSNAPVQLPVMDETGCVSTCTAPFFDAFGAAFSLHEQKIPIKAMVPKISFLGVMGCYLKKQNKHFYGLVKTG